MKPGSILAKDCKIYWLLKVISSLFIDSINIRLNSVIANGKISIIIIMRTNKWKWIRQIILKLYKNVDITLYQHYKVNLTIYQHYVMLI